MTEAATTAAEDGSRVYGAEALADPHAVFAGLREGCPLHRDEILGGGSILVPTRYTDVRALLAEPRLLRAFAVEDPGAFQGHIGNSDPPRHTRLRRLIGKALTPRRVERLRPAVEEAADRLLDAVQAAAATGPVDLVTAYAEPLAERSMAALLGVTEAETAEFRAYWEAMAGFPRSTDFPAFQAATDGLGGYFARAFDARLATPELAADDLLTALQEARLPDGDRLDRDDLLQTAVFLVIASDKTVPAMLGSALLTLLDHPDQLALLRERPELLAGAIEESLRYETPVQLTNPLRAGEAFRVHDVDLAPGDLVQAALTAANRDPRRFPDPERFDITRPVGGHVAFGHGIHFCLGAGLSRMIGEVAVGRFLDRFPHPRTAAGREPRWAPEHVMRQLAELWVEPGPARTGAAQPAPPAGPVGSRPVHHQSTPEGTEQA